MTLKTDKTEIVGISEELLKVTLRQRELLESETEGQSEKVLALQLLNLPGMPVYPLKEKTVVGRAQGDILINHPSVSNLHCSFNLSQGLITITDHKSSNGTFVLGHRITPERQVILGAGDNLLIGRVEVLIRAYGKDEVPQSNFLNVKSSFNPGKVESKKSGLNWKEKFLKIFSKKEKPKEKFKSIGKIELDKKKPQKKVKNNFKIKVTYPGTNILLRLFALITDILLFLPILFFLKDNIEARVFIDALATKLQSSFVIYLKPFVLPWWQQIPFTEVKTDALNTFVLGLPLLTGFFIFRVLGNLLFGVTLGQFLMGIRSAAPILWSRPGGVLRELIGVIITPLLIPELPAFISRKTLKEILSFAPLTSGSIGVKALGIFIFFPLCILLGLASPFFSNLNFLTTPITLETLPKKNKAVVNGELPPEFLPSKELHIGLTTNGNFITSFKDIDNLASASYIVVPSFDINKEKGKYYINPVLAFFERGTKEKINFSLAKKISLVGLIAEGALYDPLLLHFYPKINEAIHRIDDKNTNFVHRYNLAEEVSFEDELERFLRSSLSLQVNEVIPFLQENGPFVYPRVLLREKLNTLVDGNLNQLSLLTLGEKRGVKFFSLISNRGSSEEQFLFPLHAGSKELFKLSYAAGKASLANKFISDFFNFVRWDFSSLWPKDIALQEQNVFSWADFFQREKEVRTDDEVAFYQYLHRLTTLANDNGDEELKSFLKSNIKKIINAIKLESNNSEFVTKLEQL